MAALLLPDDLLLEILIRVKDAVALFRCATTCKQWCHLIADLSFLRRRWPQDANHSSSTFVGFLTMGDNGYAILTGADCWADGESSQPVEPRNSSFFKVVIISYNCDGSRYCLNDCSSNKENWSMGTNCYNSNAQLNHCALFSDAIVCRGMAQWVFIYTAEQYFRVISLNARTGDISTTKHRFKTKYEFLQSNPFLTLAMDETLSLLSTRWKFPRVEICQQEHQRNFPEWISSHG